MNDLETHILGTKIDLLQPDQYDQLFLQWVKSNRLHQILTLNPEIALYAEQHEDFRRKVLNKADLCIRDGFGLGIGAFILGTKTPKRLTGRELLDKILLLAINEDKSVYLLGGRGDTARLAAKNLQKKYSKLRIAGAEEGLTDKSSKADEKKLIERINASNASILLVAFGSPKQDQWIHDHGKALKTVRIAIGVGGIFDYLSGNVPSPPWVFRKLGMEWFFRLLTQKGRLRRIFRAVVVFPLTCLKWRLRIHFRYRKNVVGVIRNKKREILLVSPWWSKVTKWQFPQGGVDNGESPHDAILREMDEELGTNKIIVKKYHPNAYKYEWPKWYQLLRGYKGQDQDLFELEFTGENRDINIEKHGELKKWTWSSKEEVVKKLARSRKMIGKIAIKLLD